MTELDFFGHWFYFFIAAGMYYLGHKEKLGWMFRLFGEAGWVAIGVALGMSSIWLWGLFFMVIDIRGYYVWKREEREEKDRLCAEVLDFTAREIYNKNILRPTKFGFMYDPYDFGFTLEQIRLDRLGEDKTIKR